MVTSFPTRILVATDGSADAALGIRAAGDLSARSGAELYVVHARRKATVFSHSLVEAAEYSYAREKEDAQRLLEGQAELARASGGVLAGAYLRDGRPAEEISALAGELAADLVVVGSRGVGTARRMTTGSVSEGVAHQAPCAVLVVRGTWPPLNVVVGDDSSEGARRAGELAASLGRLFGATVSLLYATPESLARGGAGTTARNQWTLGVEETLELRAETLADLLGTRPGVRVELGDAATVVQDAAEEGWGPATLVAVGARGLDAVKRAALGSVSTAALRTVSGPVLIVPSLPGAPR